MSAQSFEVSAQDGHRFGLTLHTAADAHAPLLLFLPAMGTRARFYNSFGAAMAEAGVSFASCDWRGMESSSLRASHRTDFGYRHLVEEDIPAAVAELGRRLPKAPLWVGGHSLGGQLSALYAGREPATVTGIVVVAAGTVHFSAWARVGALRILALTQSATFISRLVGHFPGRRIGFAGREARGVIGDWAATARSGRYRVRGSAHDYERAMARLEKPVLALGFRADTLAPAKATDGLLAKLPRCRRTHLRWDEGQSGGVTLDHFSWAKRPDLVVPTISAWVHAQTTGVAA